MINKNSDGIKVAGHRGKWYVIEEVVYQGTYYLLEHETYGNDANWIAVNQAGELIMEDITDGAGELIDYLAEQAGKTYRAALYVGSEEIDYYELNGPTAEHARQTAKDRFAKAFPTYKGVGQVVIKEI